MFILCQQCCSILIFSNDVVDPKDAFGGSREPASRCTQTVNMGGGRIQMVKATREGANETITTTEHNARGVMLNIIIIFGYLILLLSAN